MAARTEGCAALQVLQGVRMKQKMETIPFKGLGFRGLRVWGLGFRV